jgi:hypothetical protein
MYNNLKTERAAEHLLTDLSKVTAAGLKGELITTVKYGDVEIMQTVTSLITQLLVEYAGSGV